MVTKGYCDTSLGQLHYRRAGDDAEPMVLIPHSGRSGQMFTRLICELSISFDVIAIDLPGSGQSSPLSPGTSFEDIADAVSQLCASLSLSDYHVYGIHTGNKIGARLAETGFAKTFVFAGQTHSLVADQTIRNRLIKNVAKHALRGEHPSGPSSLHDWISAIRHVQNLGLSDDTLVQISRSGDYRTQRDDVVDHLLGWEARSDLYDSNFRFDLGSCLARIEIPTLVLEFATPDEDRTIGRQGPLLIKELKNASAVILEEPDGIGFTMEHRAVEIAGIVREFIASAAS